MFRISNPILVYKPRTRQKTDADIIRDAKLEALGLPPDSYEPRQRDDRVGSATDELVSAALSSNTFIFLMTRNLGDGTVQEAHAKIMYISHLSMS